MVGVTFHKIIGSLSAISYKSHDICLWTNFLPTAAQDVEKIQMLLQRLKTSTSWN